MNCYYLDECDQPHSSWILFELAKGPPKQARKRELPPMIYQFLGPQTDGEMRMKPEYLSLCCKKCGRYDEDSVFEVGFSDPVTLRIKGDFTHTQDRMFVVSDKLLRVLRKAKTGGFESKPVGKSGWHALRVTLQVDCAEGVLKPADPYCEECGRPDGAVGSFDHASQINCPEYGATFFTTKVNYHRRLWDRDIFITEGVLKVLKENGIKGGYCSRLWTDEEVLTAEQKSELGIRWKPRGSVARL
jgi:hypothetical protein